MSGRARLIARDPGLFSTIQDLGRTGFRAWGVPVGGAFDRRSHRVANALLGNGPGAATVEMTLRGGEYEAAGGPLAMALAGADMRGELVRADGRRAALRPVGTFTMEEGERLVLGVARAGARAYLAVRGGWRAPVLMGSCSAEKALERGVGLEAERGRTAVRFPVGWGVEGLGGTLELRIVEGPDASEFGPVEWEGLRFRVSSTSGRMGVRLEGPEIQGRSPGERLSAPVVPGAVQVAGGRPIVLGPAGGTMGGYPMVACVATVDLARLAQAAPGREVGFRRITVEEARGLWVEEAGRLDRLGRIWGAAAGVDALDEGGGPGA